ncbi:MAG TPA: CinA family protein [Candidatus Limnocylindria bacterium]
MSPPSDAELARVAAQLGDALRARDWRLATAESSTGGLIGHAITMTPGASDYYAGGVICYSNLAKELALGVPHELIESHGAVSEEVAAALAVGAVHRFETDLGISVTGIAGPDGGSDRKPVGTHYLGVVRRGQPARVEHRLFEHDREGNQASAAMAALELALDEVAAAA